MNLLWFNLKVDKNDQILAFGLDWINKMAEKVDKIIILTMEKGEYSVKNNVEVYSLGKEKGYSDLRKFFVFYRLLFKILKKHEIDVVFSHMMPLFVVMAGLILRIKKIPVFLWYCHANVTRKLRLAILFSKRVFTCSNQGMNVRTKKKMVIGHGINTEIFKYPSNIRKENLILHVGRISPIKNVHILVEMMDILVNKCNETECIKLFIIGEPIMSLIDQDYYRTLKKTIGQKHLSKNIIFSGAKTQAELPEYYHDAKFLVNLSDTGSLDKVLLEAMACGCIPVSSNDSFKQLFGDKFPLLAISKNAAEIASRIQFLNSLDIEILNEFRAQFKHEVATHYTLDRLIWIIHHHYIDIDGVK